jgi:hypothetical protein
MEITQTKEELFRVLDWAQETQNGQSRFPGLSYEDGIVYTLDWILGRSEESPDCQD